MSFKCQIFQTRLTFNNNNVFAKNCDVRLIIILCVISAILPIIKCAKLENPQIRLLINDDDLLQEKINLHETAGSAAAEALTQPDHSGEHFNLYRSELKRLSYETIHRILRDENEPSYRREETELRYYQKRSPSYEENHQLIKRSVAEKLSELNLASRNLTEFLITNDIQNKLHFVSILNLANNYLTQLNISRLSNISSLQTLNLQNNSFTSIPLNAESSLRTLNLNNNLIRASHLNNNIYLRNLFLSGNLIENLSSLPLSLLKNLETLDLSHNRLKNSESSFFMERMHNLKHLNLAFNQLGSIYRETFYNLLSLNTLLLSHNNITDIDYETFLALPNLQFLDLSFNNLQGKSIRALQGITGLVALNIAFNSEIGPYMQEFVASWSLKELDASGTGLCQIPAALAQSVRSLKLTHNWLKIINCGDLDSYPLLQYLDLSFSHIEHIEDDALGRLEILEILMLDHNKLLKIPVSLPVSLEHLFLQNNEIMEIPQQAFQGLNHLKTLDLSHNKLLYLPDIMLPKLQTLNLQSSEITGISQGIIHSLPKLNDLMLEDNPIKCADLLGIAEWASTCRLRADKEGESELVAGEEEDEEENFVLKIQNLKNKFEKMHNFYEQFGMNNSFVNDSITKYLKQPACDLDDVNALPLIQKNKKFEISNEKIFKANQNLSKTLRQINLNNNQPIISSSYTTKANENKRKTVREEPKNLENWKTVKTISSESPMQTSVSTATTMQTSVLNEKQQTALTKPEASATTSSAGFASFKIQGQKETEILVPSRTTNKMKTFDQLAVDADVIATATLKQQPEITSIGNAPTKSSSNMTEIVEAVSKRTQEAEQEKILFRKTFQTNKSKKWLKQEQPLALKSGVKGIIQNMEILLKHSRSENINAAQFIKSTTFATPINSKIPATTTSPLDPQPLATTSATTTMAEAFIKNNKQASEKVAEGDKFQEKVLDVVGFERTTSKLEINLEKEKQQQHEIKTKIATTKEIKSLATKSPKSMQTNKRIETAETTTATTIIKAATLEPTLATTTTMEANAGMTKITLKILPEQTVNLSKPNKELNGFISPNFNEILTTNSSILGKIETTTTATTTTSTHKSLIEAKHDEQLAKTSMAATKLKTFKTIEQQLQEDIISEAITTAKTFITNTTLVRDKDLASNYNDNDNKRQITKSLNETSNISATTNNTNGRSSSNSTSEYNKNNQIAKIFDITTTSSLIHNNNNNTDAMDQQKKPHLWRNMMLNYHRQLLQKDVNVKCIKTNSHECNSAATETATQRPDEFGRMPTIEATLKQTTASKTSTEIPESNEAATTTATSTLAVIHKHEPLQLLIKDRHLIGTPLLMHKGENLMVTADELGLPTSSHKNEQEEHDNKSRSSSDSKDSKDIGSNNISNKENHDLETNRIGNVNKYKPHLETSQTTVLLSSTTETFPNNLLKQEHKINNNSTKKTIDEAIKLSDPLGKQDDLMKIKKPNYEIKNNKKPSLIMKKMTIITKQHEEMQHKQPLEPLENEVHNKQFDNAHYQELKPVTSMQTVQKHKHSTVNTPVSQDNTQPAKLLKQPHTFQHEHELLIQQILQDQQAETHAKLTKTEQWSDLRKVENKENHPGLILLVSSGLFLVLLLGLMHVYRCDMPWRRHSPSHHLRPHQRQNHSIEDDSHSFLSYSEGMQKWHHSTRLEAPYNSPLHNLHVRELQKTSATEKPATVKTLNYKTPPLGHSINLDNSRSLSQSSTTTTSTASASSSAILDDESFYIEMTPDSGQYTRSLQSELLPMELLNKSQMQTLDYQDAAGESQTSMEDECIVHYQQQQRHLSHMQAATPLAACSSSSAAVSRVTKPQTQSRKLGLW